MTREVTFTTPV